MNKPVYIEKDDVCGIVVCKDNYNGVVIQAVRFVDKLIPSGPDNSLTNIKTTCVIKQVEVKVVGDEDFKPRVSKAIAMVREFLAKVRKQDQDIDGLLNDYRSQHKDLNQDDKE